MQRAIWISIAALVISAILLLIFARPVSASVARQDYVTWYGWPDNDPSNSNTIAYPRSDGFPTVHNRAGGTGSWSNPITLAANPRFMRPGTRVYVPFMRRYFIMEDQCPECGRYHIDLWIGGRGFRASFVLAQESRLTRDSARVIISPARNLPVNTRPILVDRRSG